MILICIFAYLIIGFSFTLVISLVYKNFDDRSIIYIIGDTDGDTTLIIATILLWPLLILAFILFGFIPFIIKKMYVLFVAIIFGIVALVKKEEKDDRM